jgi:hypothetical protein
MPAEKRPKQKGPNMKFRSILLVGAALAVSSAAMARVAPETKPLLPLAPYGLPDATRPAQTAGYPEPEGHTQPQIAAYPEPEGHTQPQIALN